MGGSSWHGESSADRHGYSRRCCRFQGRFGSLGWQYRWCRGIYLDLNRAFLRALAACFCVEHEFQEGAVPREGVDLVVLAEDANRRTRAVEPGEAPLGVEV